ncbi:MAG: recombination mediator RecR [Bacteroidales bacterium]|nr:recombination mediator RecR [Bacteroidales bacterium]
MYKENNYPSQLLEDAVEAISTLPGVGKRGALRLALHLLGSPAENVHHFTKAINDLRDNVRYCRVCNMISDTDICSVCGDSSRDRSTVCVVESVRDVMSIENTMQYKGLYHVLGGVISPLDGIGPDNLAIDALERRLAAPDTEIKEVILALDGDVEGETTSFYLYRRIAGYGIAVTTLARGLGFGDDLEYADSLTLGRSILARQPFSIERK